jgi:methyltransferase
MPWWYVVLVALVGLERLAELIVARRNAAWSRARGGLEFAAGHYPTMVVLHSALLAGALAEVLLADPGAGAGRAGLALVVHPHPRTAVEYPHHCGFGA